LASPEKRDMGGIIALLLILVVGLALTPTVVELVTTAVAGGSGVDNLTGAAAAICGLVPLFWILLMIGVVLAGVIVWLKN